MINDNDNLFIDLYFEKFIELLSNNLIFEQNYFINQLNISIYNSNLDFKNDFLIKREYYTELLEKEITKFEYSKENISDKISFQYRTNIKGIDEIKKNKTITLNHRLD